MGIPRSCTRINFPIRPLQFLHACLVLEGGNPLPDFIVLPILPKYKLSLNGVHPNMSPFSTRDLIWVNYQVLSEICQLIFLSFSYLNSARHNSVVEFCRELNTFLKRSYSKLTHSFVAIHFWIFSIIQISKYISPERRTLFF